MAKGKGKKKASTKQKEKEEAAAKKRLEEEEQAAEEDDLEFQKACLEIRVKELEQLKVGMQRKCEFLETQNELYKTQFEEMKEEKDDIIAHLKRCHSEGKTTVKELEDRLYGTQKTREDEAKEFLQRLAQKERERKEMEESMEKTILELNAKLATLEDFRLQRENLLSEKEKLKKTLVDERTTFQEEFDSLENKTVMYKDRLRKEAIEMLVKMSRDVQKAGKLCLTATVKSAINSNIKLQNELETTSRSNVALRKKMEKLDESLREKRMTVEVIEEENTLVHRKCLEYKEIVMKLIDTQLDIESEMKQMKKYRDELQKLRNIHSQCRSDDEVRDFVGEEIEKLLERQRMQELQKETLSPEEVHQLEGEVFKLRDIVVKLAITAKNLAQASTCEEQDYHKEQLKSLLKRTYAIALEIPDLPPEVMSLLTVKFPDVTPALGTIK
ncbi:unnamed protein product [Orchesella dallaii]|uniref:Cilia- and flagella-associated protein 157 n=1 Tax=Orchesella dallaii TaxID=48710 RepID=A0ABP1QIM2_9HEXA